MNIDESALDGLRASLAADDYQLAVTDTSDTGVEVRITAGPDACAECLVPEPIMRSVLHAALGVPEAAISLVYPADTDSR